MDDTFPYPHLDPEELGEVPSIEKQIFDMVYQWGRVGIVVDYTSPAFQALCIDLKIKTLKDLKQEVPF
jgi:hypothetical protein